MFLVRGSLSERIVQTLGVGVGGWDGGEGKTLGSWLGQVDSSLQGSLWGLRGKQGLTWISFMGFEDWEMDFFAERPWIAL